MPQLRIWPLAAVLLCSPMCRAALGHGVPGRGASLLTWAQLGVFWPPGRYQPERIRVKWRRGQLGVGGEQAAGWVLAARIDLERQWIDQSRQLSQHGGGRRTVGPCGGERVLAAPRAGCTDGPHSYTSSKPTGCYFPPDKGTAFRLSHHLLPLCASHIP